MLDKVSEFCLNLGVQSGRCVLSPVVTLELSIRFIQHFAPFVSAGFWRESLCRVPQLLQALASG